MENETYMLKHTLSNVIRKHSTNVIQGALEHPCMFKNPLLVIETETYMLKHTRSSCIYKNTKIELQIKY